MVDLSFSDLIQYASENGFGQLADLPVVENVTEGKDWAIPIHIDPGDGNSLDLSGVHITARVLSAVDGTELVALTQGAWEETATGRNYCVLSAASIATAGLGDTGNLTRSFPLHVTLTSPAGQVVDFCSIQESRVVINQGD